MLGGLEPTPPFCALFLGLDMNLGEMGFVPALHIHSSTYDTEEHFKNLEPKMVDEKGMTPFFRFQFAPLSDPTSAPEGKTAFVMHYIPTAYRGWGNENWEQKVAEVMIKRAEKVIPDLSKHIEYQEFASPATIDRYTFCGPDASIGWALTPQQVGPKRLSQVTPVENLLLSGHWTAPALGVMSTVVSGLQAAKTILSKEGISEPLADIGIKNGVIVE
jgi:phytoene dehydrogenase-like protein